MQLSNQFNYLYSCLICLNPDSFMEILYFFPFHVRKLDCFYLIYLIIQLLSLVN